VALQRTKLLNVQSVTGIATVGIFTAGTTTTPAGTSGTTYLRGVIMHNTSSATGTSSLYIYPSTVAATGVGQTAYRLARVDLSSNETFFFESNYPIVLTSGDKVVVEITAPATGGTGIGTVINYQILGDTDI
jgi:hypothetical protein